MMLPPILGTVKRYRRRGTLLALLATGTGLTVALLLSSDAQSQALHVGRILSQGDVEALRDYLRSFGAWAPVVSLLMMVVQALVAPVPSFVVTLANGLAFGGFWGGWLSLVGHGLAAAVCFGLARTLGRTPIDAIMGKNGPASAGGWFSRFSRWGPYGIVLARLVPGVGFDAVSYAAGLSGMRFWPFAAATLVGAAPQAFLYAYLGQHATRYAWPLLGATLVVTGGLALTAIVRAWRARRAVAPANNSVSPCAAGVGHGR